MSISLEDHENRITTLENLSKNSFKSARIMRQYIHLKPGPVYKYDISQYIEYDFICIRWDSWGAGGYPESQSTDSLLPVGLLKQNWYQVTDLWDPDLTGSDGVQLNISGNTLNLKYQGTEGNTGVWQIDILKLYYSFSYNIIYRAMHLLEKFMSQTKEVLAL